MTKKFLILVLGTTLLTSTQSIVSAQSVIFHRADHTVSVDGHQSFRIERQCPMGGACYFMVADLDNHPLFTIIYRSYFSPFRSNANPTGEVQYHEFSFFDQRFKAETEYIGMGHQQVAKFIVKNRLIENGQLNQEVVAQFAFMHGRWYSEQMNAIYSNFQACPPQQKSLNCVHEQVPYRYPTNSN